MAAMKNSTEKLKAGCRLEKVCGVECGTDSGADLFSRDWEVFVIKRDESTGKLLGKLASCALEPV
jgi:hypothetical protein